LPAQLFHSKSCVKPKQFSSAGNRAGLRVGQRNAKPRPARAPSLNPSTKPKQAFSSSPSDSVAPSNVVIPSRARDLLLPLPRAKPKFVIPNAPSFGAFGICFFPGVEVDFGFDVNSDSGIDRPLYSDLHLLCGQFPIFPTIYLFPRALFRPSHSVPNYSTAESPDSHACNSASLSPSHVEVIESRLPE